MCIHVYLHALHVHTILFGLLFLFKDIVHSGVGSEPNGVCDYDDHTVVTS